MTDVDNLTDADRRKLMAWGFGRSEYTKRAVSAICSGCGVFIWGDPISKVDYRGGGPLRGPIGIVYGGKYAVVAGFNRAWARIESPLETLARV